MGAEGFNPTTYDKPTATPPAPEPPTPVDEPTPAPTRSRSGIVWAIALIVGAGLLIRPLIGWDQAPTTDPEQIAAAVEAAADPVAADMATASAHLASTGTFDGLALPGAQVAARGTTFYAARLVDGNCVAYGAMGGQELTAAIDPTGAACAGQIVAVQAQLDAAHNATTTATTATATATLDDAAAAAIRYASRNFTDGMPSFEGLPQTLGGAVVVDPSADLVTLRVNQPGVCLTTWVNTAGQVGEPAPC